MAAAVAGIGLAVWPAIRHARYRNRAPQLGELALLDLPVHEPVNGNGNGADPLISTPASSFPGEPELMSEPGSGPDPWLAASRLPFYHGQPEDRSAGV